VPASKLATIAVTLSLFHIPSSPALVLMYASPKGDRGPGLFPKVLRPTDFIGCANRDVTDSNSDSTVGCARFPHSATVEGGKRVAIASGGISPMAVVLGREPLIRSRK